MPQILLKIQDHVATLTLNRPNKGNALTAVMIDQLQSYLDQLKNNVNIRVIVLTGAGKYFCSGLDLSTTSLTDKKIQEDTFDQGIQVFDTLYHYPKPVIARINGPCLGGGVGLVFTTDIRIAHQNAYFALSEVKRGLVPAIISQYIVPELGPHKAKEYMLTGRRVSASELHGALSATVSSEADLDTKVNHYTDLLLESAPGAMSSIKRLVHVIGENDPQKAKHVKDTFLQMMKSKEAAYGIQSFMNEKKPDWSTLYSKL
ncbi:hypothetical protein G6F56_009765 [Rhizopus delemar]|uniref:Uncharacterized protein n=1 Tax=Rhizopus stolonifer TaxID=4846 RepID=A0A367KYI5_RHIST|nr:hypothetical protein G6F56_009765 [Rhizopus delemar]RCI06952.1 hypothetical protein CU098_007231 [Rhizopus stolonifer]